MKRLDFTKLNYYEKPLPMKEALQEIYPIEVSNEVFGGEERITVNSAAKVAGSPCVKLEISVERPAKNDILFN